MEKEKRLTVIIPTYNSAKYILNLLECLSNQIYQDFEILIVDDGSTDNTPSLIKKFSSISHIRLVESDQNYGVSHARNVGLLQAKTPYITFIDADDWIDICTFENCSKYFIEDLDVITYSLSQDYIKPEKRIYKYIYDKDCIISGKYALKIYGHTIHDRYKITPIVNNKIYKLSFLKKNKILFCENTRYQEDDIFTFKVLLYAEKLAFVANCCYHYLQNPNSALHQISTTSIEHFIESYQSLLIYLKQKRLYKIYKDEFYLKFKGSFVGVLQRTIDFCKNEKNTRKYLTLLFSKMMETFNITDFLNYFDLKKS